MGTDALKKSYLKRFLVASIALFIVVVSVGIFWTERVLDAKVSSIKSNDFFDLTVKSEELSHYLMEGLLDLQMVGHEMFASEGWNEGQFRRYLVRLSAAKPRYLGFSYRKSPRAPWKTCCGRGVIPPSTDELALWADPRIAEGGMALVSTIQRDPNGVKFLTIARRFKKKSGQSDVMVRFSLDVFVESIEKILVPNLGETILLENDSSLLFSSERNGVKLESEFSGESERIQSTDADQWESELGVFTVFETGLFPEESLVSPGVSRLPIDRKIVEVRFPRWKLISFVSEEVLSEEKDSIRSAGLTYVVAVFVFLWLILAVGTFLRFSNRLTQLRLAQERERGIHQSKMATVGEMAAGIAHEINNPLAIIVWYCDEMVEQLEDGKPDAESFKGLLSKMKETSFRISRIIKSMRSISRQSDADPLVPTPVKVIVEDALLLARNRLTDRGIEIKQSDVDENLEIVCRPGEVSQVILNLLNNAGDAIHALGERWIHISVETSSAKLQIKVVDSGHGIPKEVQEKLFTPFFTTKERGEGTGLGLSISARLVEANNGDLSIDDDASNTTFVLSFPLFSGGANRGARPGAMPPV